VIVIACDGTGWWWVADNQELSEWQLQVDLFRSLTPTCSRKNKAQKSSTISRQRLFCSHLRIESSSLSPSWEKWEILCDCENYRPQKNDTDSCAKIQASIPQTAPLLGQPSPDEEEPNASALPPPPPSIQLTPLLGSTPTDHLRTLYALYASQVATIVWTAEAGGLMDERRRSVIVGLALKKSGEEEGQGLSIAERETFHQVMGMVRDLVKD